jgi:cysteine desulfurase
MNEPLYLDNNATTRVCDEALEEIVRVSRDCYGNASSIHSMGKAAHEILENSREKIAALLKVRPGEIIFTSGGSEGNNFAIKGLADLQNLAQKDHIVTTLVEHSSVYQVCRHLETRGFKVTYLKPDPRGRISLKDLRTAITDRTFLVSILYANNEIGTVQDIPSIGKLCADRGVVLHTDGVQAFGKVPVELYKDRIGLFSTAGHKIRGPKGVGFLFKQRDISLTPLIHGGGQEFDLRSGTENVPLIAGLAKACEIRFANLEKESACLKELTLHFHGSLKKLIPLMEVNGDLEHRIPNTINLRFPGVSGPKVIAYLSDEGIYASPSSACSANSTKPSRILTSLGLMADEAFSSVRFSFNAEITRDQVDRAVKVVKAIVDKLL